MIKHTRVILAIMLVCMVMAVAIASAGCVSKFKEKLQTVQNAKDLEESTLNIGDPDGNGSGGHLSETPDGSKFPFLGIEGDSFNASAREFCKAINMVMPENPFGEESIYMQCIRYTNEQGIMLGLQPEESGSNIQVVMLSCRAGDGEAANSLIRLSGLLFRICNRNSTDVQAAEYLSAMSLAPYQQSAVKEGVCKQSKTMTYNVGVYDGYLYTAISSMPASGVKIQVDRLLQRESDIANQTEPAPTPEPSPEVAGVARMTYNGMDVTLVSAKGNRTDDGHEYVSFVFHVKNTTASRLSFDEACYYEAIQNGVLMVRFDADERDRNATSAQLEPGEEKTFNIGYSSAGYAGITFAMKELFGADDTVVTITF